MYNYVGREENAVNDSFEKIGTVFDNPTSDVESKVVDGESVIAVHPADGSTYLIGRGATDNLFIELNCTAEEYNDETLAEEQETPIETLANELTLTEAYNKLDALLYPDGIGWRKLAPLDECLEMEHIIYYYYYYESERCDEIRKICEENGIDTNLLEFCVLESAEEQETSIEPLANELTLTEAYNKLNDILIEIHYGAEEQRPEKYFYLDTLESSLENGFITYFYNYYEPERCDEIRKICEENEIDTSLLMFCALESGEEQETSIEPLANELTLTEAYNKLNDILIEIHYGAEEQRPEKYFYLDTLESSLENGFITYFYNYYEPERCDEIRKICEENEIDTSLLMFCALESGEEPETPIETLLEGDADGSGKIDILDVITLNKAILGKEELSETQLKAIDFNGNGKPDSEEALTLMKYIVGLITSFTE